MNTVTFSISESVKSAWGLFTKNWMVFLGAMVISFVIDNIPTAVLGNASQIGSLLSYLISIFFMAGMLRIMLNAVDGKTPKIAELFSEGKSYLKLLFTAILVNIAVIIGLIFLIIPGIYVGIRLFFALTLVVDKGLGPIEAIKESWRLTEGNIFHLLKLWLVFIGITILGILALIVGLLVAVPVATLLITIAYRKFSPAASMEMQAVPLPEIATTAPESVSGL